MPHMNLVFPMVLLTLLLACLPASAASYRHFLLTQNDIGAEVGFQLNLENDGPDGAPLKLKTMKLVMRVGDGKGMRQAVCIPDWVPGVPYTVKAVADKGQIGVWLNGALAAKASGKFVPNPSPALAGGVPGWASAPTEYLVSQTSVKLISGGKTIFSRTIAPVPSGPLSLFDRLGAIQPTSALEFTPDEPMEATVEFTILPVVNAKDSSPLIDSYGQVIHGDWPGKVKSDKDLWKALTAEKAKLKEWGYPKNRDKFGGSTDLGWKVKGSGYYRLVMKNGMWWLATPEGNPCFYTGICTAPSPLYPKTPVTDREYMFSELPPRDMPDMWLTNQWGEEEYTEYAGFIPWNLFRKFGSSWKDDNETLAAQRIKAWGFSGIGKWGGMDGVPHVSVLQHGDVPNLAGHPDIFDPETRRIFKESLDGQITPKKYDPMIVGWSLGNEYGQIITSEQIKSILGMEGTAPAKKALVEYAVKNLYGGSLESLQTAWHRAGISLEGMVAAKLTAPMKDVKELRRFYADAYYSFIYTTIKTIDPRHLHFGFWIVPGWWEEEADWDIISRHCDAIGYDRYSLSLMDDAMRERVARTNKPVLLGEFSFPALYSGTRGFGAWGNSTVDDDDDAGMRYAELMKDAAHHPMVVGTLWFEYRDEPVTGRGPGTGDSAVFGEHHAFGLVDGTDTPKWTLVGKVREANLAAPGMRAGLVK